MPDPREAVLHPGEPSPAVIRLDGPQDLRGPFDVRLVDAYLRAKSVKQPRVKISQEGETC